MVKHRKFKINDYEGPLDLLLDLIKSKKINITEISLVNIADQFIEIVNEFDFIDLNRVSEYFLLATQLLDYKTKYLLAIEEGKSFSKKIESSEDDLLQRLIIYERYKNVSKQMLNLLNSNTNFSKEENDLDEFLIFNTAKDYKLTSSGIFDIEKAIERIYKSLALNRKIDTTIKVKRLSVEQRRLQLQSLLSNSKLLKFSNLFNDNFSRYIISITLLCLLEMANENLVSLKQTDDFSDIIIKNEVLNG